MCNGYRDLDQHNTSVIFKHYLLSSMSLWGASPESWHLSPDYTSEYNAIHITSEEIISQRIALKPRLYTYVHSYGFHLHEALSPRKAPITHYAIVHPSAYKPPVCEPAEQSVTDIRTRHPLRISAPDTGVLSNLPKDQPGLGETTYETYLSFPCVGYIHI